MSGRGPGETSVSSAKAEELARNRRNRRHTRPDQPQAIIEEDEQAIDDGDNFPSRVVTEAMRTLFIVLPNEAKTRIVDCEVNLATLQRMNIYAIQRDLVHLTSKIVRSGKMEVRPLNGETVSQAMQVRELMKEYCRAWRDWDLIMKSASIAELDKFRITTHKMLSTCLIEEAGMLTEEIINRVQEHVPDERKLSLRLLESLDRKSTSKLPGEPRHAALRDDMIQEATQRFFWGMGGGLALIGPMLLMVLHKTLLTTLLTSSVAVIIFAFIVALISSGLIPGMKTIDLGPRDVLAATATYAAVLVVFVGASS